MSAIVVGSGRVENERLKTTDDYFQDCFARHHQVVALSLSLSLLPHSHIQARENRQSVEGCLVLFHRADTNCNT